MKKFLLIGMFFFSCIAFASAQSALNASKSTLTNADTSYLTAPRLGAPYTVLSIQLNVTKISGTVAGTAVVQGSIDGINYTSISSDTLNLVNGNNIKLWALGNAQYPYHRVVVITNGTQSSSVNGLVWYNR
ncbi:MAG: hypothetical protein EPN37_07200 [Chitinophagaceae bacterium]|nr:MAG: hypothetical protein EPN37_07200 [Chitinophagaceae bacterium]